MTRGRRRRRRGDAALVLAVLRVVQLLVIKVIQREVRGMLVPRWRVDGHPSVTRTERQHGPHAARPVLLLLLCLRLLLLQRRRLRLRRLVAGIRGLSAHVLTRVARVLGLMTRIQRLVPRVLSLLRIPVVTRVLTLLAWILTLVSRVLALLTRILGLVPWVLMMSRILALVTGVLVLVAGILALLTGILTLVTRVLRLAGVLGLMTRIRRVRGRLVGLLTRILCVVGRSGRRSRWTRIGDALRGRRGWSRNRGLPRGSRQRGRIPWLDGLLHDGTHHLAQPSSQPADFYLRPEGPCLLVRPLLLPTPRALSLPLSVRLLLLPPLNAIAHPLRERAPRLTQLAIDTPTSSPKTTTTVHSVLSSTASSNGSRLRLAADLAVEPFVTRENVVDAWRRCRSSCKMASDRCSTALRLSEGGRTSWTKIQSRHSAQAHPMSSVLLGPPRSSSVLPRPLERILSLPGSSSCTATLAL